MTNNTNRPDFTIGIEEEFMIVDPKTGELRSSIQEIYEDGILTLKEKIKPEMHMSVVEIGTKICTTTEEARKDITQLRSEIAQGRARRGTARAAPASARGRRARCPRNRCTRA